MKIRLFCVGKLSRGYLCEGVEDYAERIGRYLPFSQVELKEEKGGRKADPSERVLREGERLSCSVRVRFPGAPGRGPSARPSAPL